MRCKAGCLGALVLRQEGESRSLEKFASAASRCFVMVAGYACYIHHVSET